MIYRRVDVKGQPRHSARGVLPGCRKQSTPRTLDFSAVDFPRALTGRVSRGAVTRSLATMLRIT